MKGFIEVIVVGYENIARGWSDTYLKPIIQTFNIQHITSIRCTKEFKAKLTIVDDTEKYITQETYTEVIDKIKDAIS